MLKWLDIIKFADQGNSKPDRTVTKTDVEWKSLLTPEQYHITRNKGTERAHSSEMCSRFEPGIYACVCCETLLFDASEKFESGTGWPSFTQPIKENAIAYQKDQLFDMSRVETICNTCDAHLGHVFPDGPSPGGLRYCMNAIALKKIASRLEKATFGGGCFWCTEAIFQKLRGVEKVESGYSGGTTVNPTYKEVSRGGTGHTEAIQIVYDPARVSYEELLNEFWHNIDPTNAGGQFCDWGSQYRSEIFYQSTEQERLAR